MNQMCWNRWRQIYCFAQERTYVIAVRSVGICWRFGEESLNISDIFSKFNVAKIQSNLKFLLTQAPQTAPVANLDYSKNHQNQPNDRCFEIPAILSPA